MKKSMSTITKLIAVLEEELKHQRETYKDDPYMSDEIQEGFIEGLDYARWIANKLYQRELSEEAKYQTQEIVKENFKGTYNANTGTPFESYKDVTLTKNK